MGAYKIALPIYGFCTETDSKNAEKSKPFLHIPSGVIYWYPSEATLTWWLKLYKSPYHISEFEHLTNVSQEEIDRVTSEMIPTMLLIEPKDFKS